MFFKISYHQERYEVEGIYGNNQPKKLDSDDHDTD